MSNRTPALATTELDLPARSAVDVALALSILALGALILLEPAAVPGLVPAM